MLPCGCCLGKKTHWVPRMGGRAHGDPHGDPPRACTLFPWDSAVSFPCRCHTSQLQGRYLLSSVQVWFGGCIHSLSPVAQKVLLPFILTIFLFLFFPCRMLALQLTAQGCQLCDYSYGCCLSPSTLCCYNQFSDWGLYSLFSKALFLQFQGPEGLRLWVSQLARASSCCSTQKEERKRLRKKEKERAQVDTLFAFLAAVVAGSQVSQQYYRQ